MHEEPTTFTVFQSEIDPSAEWLETELIPDPDTRELLRTRDHLVQFLIAFLQQRSLPLHERIKQAFHFLERMDPDTDKGSPTEEDSLEPEIMMRKFSEIFDPVSEALEKPAQAAGIFMRNLAGGSKGYIQLLSENIRKGLAIYEPFIREYPYLEENFLVHCVFSDSLKQFYRYQNETLTTGEILRFEARLLTGWYWFFRVLMYRAALQHGKMTEELFLRTVSHADKLYWHYPDWFARCAGRMGELSYEDLRKIIGSLI